MHLTRFLIPEDMSTSDELQSNGEKKLIEVFGNKLGTKTIENLKQMFGEFASDAIEFAYGNIYSNDQLDLKQREIVTISMLTALGNSPDQLKAHIFAGLKSGLTKEQIRGIIIQATIFAGFPQAINAMMIAESIFSKSD